MSRKEILVIPFDSNGNQVPTKYSATIWRDNEVFQDILVYKRVVRTKYSVWFEFTRTFPGNQPVVIVMLSDFDKWMKNGRIVSGKITGRFTWKKRGENYAVTEY